MSILQQNNKSLFGVFLNQARLNAYITLCHISDIMGTNPSQEDSISTMRVLDFLDDTNNVKDANRVFELIDKYFPMLGIIYNSQKDKAEKGKVDHAERSRRYKEILQCLLKAINSKRNEYCHSHSKDTLADKNVDVGKLCRYLDGCLDASVRRVKEDRELKEEEVSHLQRKTAEGKGVNKRVIDNPEFYYHFRDEQGRLSEKGLAFLASIFLEKRDAWLFLKKRHGFKQDNEPKYKATLESFCRYRIKLPKPVVSSDVDKDGLALDMLNELGKCPREMFGLLDRDKQEKFRVKVDGDDEIMMRRYSDRFAYFTLRYCDENELFDDLRFQIDLGRYYFEFYDKKAIDGNIYPRELSKRLKTFGQIKEVKDKVSEEWKNITRAFKLPDDIDSRQAEKQENDNGNTSYRPATTPHYHLVDNQIGLCISRNLLLPDINSADGKIELKTPDAWLSIYSLPAMMFHGLKFEFKNTEKLIKEYIEQQRQVLEVVAKTGKLPEDEDIKRFIPEALKKQRDTDKQRRYAENKLKEMLNRTKARIRAIEKTQERADDKSNKPGKKQFFDIRAGKLADFLARDIIALQAFDPAKKGKDKITATDFQVLQATLAYYGARKNAIAGIFKRSGLLDGDNPHPFLNKIKQVEMLQYNSIVDFYKAYLNQKCAYLEKCIEQGDYDHQFLRPTRQRYAGDGGGLKAVALKLLDKPVNIPNNLFQEQIREFICAEYPALKKQEMNTAYMIQVYFEKTYGGQQPFYGYKRKYPVVSKAEEYSKKRENKEKELKNTLEKITPEMSYKELKELVEAKIPKEGKFNPEKLRDNLLKGCKDFKNNERLLRRLKVQDMVSFMMIEKNLKDQLRFGTEQQKDNPLKLENIDPDDDRTVFAKPISCETEVAILFSASERHHDHCYVEHIKKQYPGCYREINRGKKIELKYKITSENTKLKDLGKYRRYFYDRRLPGLLIWKYGPSDEIKYADIEAEIKAYEQHRIEIVNYLYQLEKDVIDKYGLQPMEDKDYITFNQVVEAIKEKLVDCDDKSEILLDIRNAFLHNQFPVFSRGIQSADGNTIAEKMCFITESYVKCITEQINESDKEIANV